MTIHSLRPMARPDNLKSQVRAGQSLARRLYLATLLLCVGWIIMLIFGPMVLIEGDGLVVQNSMAVMPPFNAKVVSVSVRPGDHIHVGQRIATVFSPQMLDMISDLTTRKLQAEVRSKQIAARLIAISLTLPVAETRVQDAQVAETDVNKAMTRGFSTTTRVADMMRDSYEAVHAVVSLKAERAALQSEQSAVHDNFARLSDALARAERSYQDGAITSPVSGTVGPRVVVPGTVLSSGDKIAEVYYGTKYVLAYLPTDRLYSAEAGQKVIITDGVNRQLGRLERIEGITDQLPPEFQSRMGSVDRQQVASISISDSAMFPLLSKVRVTSPDAPTNLVARALSKAHGGVKLLASMVGNWKNEIAENGLLTTVARAAPVLHGIVTRGREMIMPRQASAAATASREVFGVIGPNVFSRSVPQKLRWFQYCGHRPADLADLAGDDRHRTYTPAGLHSDSALGTGSAHARIQRATLSVCSVAF